MAAAEHYGLKILAEQIEDNPRNRTRFWVVGRVQAPPTGRDKTSLLFSVAHKPGALARALAAFADNGVSLTFIESRPTKQTPWEYVFFVDVVGHVGCPEDSPLRQALGALEPHCIFCRVLGSYPEAPEIPDPGQVGPSTE
jgi:chorismate mutase / prephenate dehydratase